MATKTVNARLQQAHMSDTSWVGKVLLDGEIGIDDTNFVIKIGNGLMQYQGLAGYGWIPPGTILIMGKNSGVAPKGYLKCDGAAVSRTTYAMLYSVIGQVYGPGNGSTTFNLPDMTGRFPRSADTFSAISPVVGGQNAVTLTVNTMPAHSHQQNTTTWTDTSGGDYFTPGGGTRWIRTGNSEVRTVSDGGGASHENQPEYTSFYFYIKY